MTYFGSLDIETQERLIEEIYTDIQKYRSLVDLVVVYDDEDFALQETRTFNDYLKLFDRLLGHDEPLDDPEEVDLDMLLNDSSGISIDPEQ